jgi:hypothetical protein
MRTYPLQARGSVWLFAALLAGCESSGPDAPPSPSAADGGASTVAAAPDSGGSSTSQAGADGSASSATDAAASPVDSGVAAAGDCPTRFAIATHISVDLSWPESVALVAGKGKVQVWSKDTHTPTANGYALESIPCGSSQPVFTGTSFLDDLQFAYDIPASTFDLPIVPRFAGRAEWRDGMLVTEPGAVVLGAQLSDPVAAWPARESLVPFDHDGDGKPGIPAFPRQGAGFGMFPLDIGFTKFADQVHIATRSAIRFSAPRAGCDERIEGSVEPIAVDYTFVGCHALDRGECTDRELNLLANNTPRYTVAAQGKRISLPIAETATCAEVLAALPSE